MDDQEDVHHGLLLLSYHISKRYTTPVTVFLDIAFKPLYNQTNENDYHYLDPDGR
jgi:hypothetical protein